MKNLENFDIEQNEITPVDIECNEITLVNNKKILRPNGLVVLSLFDGMSCGRLALEKANIKIAKYLASEIKPFAINHTLQRYPNTISIGDVTKVYYDNKTKTLYANCEKEIVENVNATNLSQTEIDDYISNGYEITLDGTIQKWIPSNEVKYQGDIDILIGGSPCQNFSMANSFQNANSYGLAGSKSKLFYEYARIKEEVNPTFFFLENVKMKKDSETQLNKFMGVNGLHINSNTLSIQNRDRIYWTNIKDFKNLKKDDNIKENNIPQPNDKTFGYSKKNNTVTSINFQNYILKTLPKFEQMLYIQKYPMCYSLFTKEQQLEMDKYVEKDMNGNVIKVNFDIENITDEDIDTIINISSNVWVINELEETRKFYRKLGQDTFKIDGVNKEFTTKHKLSNKDIVYIIHSYLIESLVKKTPSRDKMWNEGKIAQFACKNITNETKMSCLTRKQDRFPNSGLISFGYYCRFVNRFEICKGQTVPFYFLNDLNYTQIQDVCGDGWTVDTIRYIFSYLKQVYEF